MTVHDIQGSRMVLREGDKGISTDLAQHGVREPSATRAYQDLLSSYEDPVTVVDIGANIGYYALMPCSIQGDQAEVLAIEPDPGNIATLQRNLELNGYEDSVTVLEGAVGEQEGEVELRVMAESNLSTIHPEHNSGTPERTVSVQVAPLSSYCEEAGLELSDIDISGWTWRATRSLS